VRIGANGNMPRYIVDAIIVAKWILPVEPYEENTIRLKENSIEGIAELHSPSILIYEVGNILWRASKMQRIAHDDAKEALKLLASMKITFYDLRWQDMAEGFSISSALDLTIYDIAYILLSNRLKAPLITADDRLYERAKTISRVIHVKEY
jgi:predicted nucleic acid-binding protein